MIDSIIAQDDGFRDDRYEEHDLVAARYSQPGQVGRAPADLGIEFGKGQRAPLAAVTFVYHGRLACHRPGGMAM